MNIRDHQYTHQLLVSLHQANIRKNDASANGIVEDVIPIITKEDERILDQFHQFIRDDEDDEEKQTDWRVRMARRYYDKLFKEYAVVDLSQYTSGNIGMRWRTEKEVIDGIGQFVCGAKKCQMREGLHSFEVPFRYVENNIAKVELVKVRVCKSCSEKLFYKKLEKKRQRELDDTCDDLASIIKRI